MPKLCLNMIVRDEEHVIRETLECIYKYIDYYLIVDTGSVDKTEQVIKQFFEEKGIPGEIHHDKWVDDFGHSRSVALRLCRGKADYAWVIDADDIIKGNLILPEKLTADAYSLKYGSGFTYHRTQIFKLSDELDWHYEDILHEYPLSKKNRPDIPFIKGDYHIDSRRLGSRSKDSTKYLRDAKLLEKAFKKRPDHARYAFYCAQSWFDYGETQRGIDWYKKRIEMGGWYEEVYYSYYRIAKGLAILNKPLPEIEAAYLEAWTYCKIRAEPLYEIALLHRKAKNFQKAYEYSLKASQMPFPEQCVLFIYQNVYQFGALYEYSLSASHLKKFMEAYLTIKKLLSVPQLPDDIRKACEANLKYATQNLGSERTTNCLLHVGNRVITSNKVLNSLLDTLITHNVHLVGDKVDLSTITSDNLIPTTAEIIDQLKINFDMVYLYDNLNYIYHNSEIKGINLLVDSEHFNFCLKNGATVRITNEKLLNRLLKNVSKIICSNSRIVEAISKRYSIDKGLLIDLSSNDSAKILNRFSLKYSVKINTYDKRLNGLELQIPPFIKKLPQEKAKEEGSKTLIFNFLKTYIEEFPDRPEPLYYMMEFYDRISNHEMMKRYVDIAQRMIKGKGDQDNLSHYKQVVDIQRARYNTVCGKYQESYDVCNKLYHKNKDVVMRNLIEDSRDRNIEHLKDRLAVYPTNKVKQLKNSANPKIVLTMTTCKRYDLFEKTINSFLNCCLDHKKIDYWLCVDDNSDEADRVKMEKNYPFFDFYWKGENQKGHWRSMNIIHEFVEKNGVDYLIHMEDDFHFVNKLNYVQQSVDILESDEGLGQVCFNRNYSEVENYKQRIPGGIPKETKTGRRYLEHEHYRPGSHEYNLFVNKYKGYGTNAYWPHFSFRPSMMRGSMLTKVGKFCNTGHFEMQYAKEYRKMDYKTAFFDDFCCIHIGKKTWEKSGINSYALNETDQFRLTSSFLSTFVLSKNDNHTVWNRFKEFGNEQLHSFQKIDNRDMSILSDAERKLFSGNNFNWDRRVISYFMAHIDVWRSLKTDYCLIINDDIEYHQQFRAGLDLIVDDMRKTKLDFVLLGLDGEIDQTVDNFSLEKHGTIYSEPAAYIVSKQAALRLVALIEKNGLADDLYKVFDAQHLDIWCVKPFIVSNRASIAEKPLPHLDGYRFYSQLDSFGDDLKYVGKQPIEELKKICDSLGGAGFNTLGYIKSKVTSEDKFICTKFFPDGEDGLYVKNLF